MYLYSVLLIKCNCYTYRGIPPANIMAARQRTANHISNCKITIVHLEITHLCPLYMSIIYYGPERISHQQSASQRWGLLGHDFYFSKMPVPKIRTICVSLIFLCGNMDYLFLIKTAVSIKQIHSNVSRKTVKFTTKLL